MHMVASGEEQFPYLWLGRRPGRGVANYQSYQDSGSRQVVRVGSREAGLSSQN